MEQIKDALYFFFSIKETSWYRTNELLLPTEEQCLYLELNDSSNTTSANIKRN